MSCTPERSAGVDDLFGDLKHFIDQRRQKGNSHEENQRKQNLIDDLQDKFSKEKTPERRFLVNNLINLAKRGYFSDFDSEDEFCMMTLVKYCSDLGYHDLAQKAKSGKYDHPYSK